MSASLARSTKAGARSIAVVGGGASGALMAAHLLKRAGDDVRLTLIEPRAQIGRGLAYATESDSHRLNVRASNMTRFQMTRIISCDGCERADTRARIAFALFPACLWPVPSEPDRRSSHGDRRATRALAA
jgi:phytoene dehydrogenase-like protein